MYGLSTEVNNTFVNSSFQDVTDERKFQLCSFSLILRICWIIANALGNFIDLLIFNTNTY